MLSRYKKIKEDMPLSAAKIEDDTFGCWLFASRTNVFYLLLLSTKQAELAKLKS